MADGDVKIEGKSKDLGQVAAMYIGATAPLNTKILWYDTTTTGNVCPVKYYNLSTNTWTRLGS